MQAHGQICTRTPVDAQTLPVSHKLKKGWEKKSKCAGKHKYMQECLTVDTHAHTHTHTHTYAECGEKPVVLSRDGASGRREGERKQLAAGILPLLTL